MSESISESIQQRNVLREHKKRLLTIALKDTPFQKKLKQRNHTLDMIK